MPGDARPPIAAYVYDGGVLTQDRFNAIPLQEEELLPGGWWPGRRSTRICWALCADRVLAALDALEAGTGTVELENGLRPPEQVGPA